MSLEHILLGMLKKPASGYDLKTAFNEGAKYFWSAELAQIYPTLQRMEKRGWLKSQSQPSPKGPPRRIYQRTAQGSKALQEWLRGEPILGTERFAYIAQLIFMDELRDLKRTFTFLEKLRGKLAEFAHMLESVDADYRSRYRQLPDDLNEEEFHDWLCTQLGVQSLQAKVRWCETAMSLVKHRQQREKRHE